MFHRCSVIKILNDIKIYLSHIHTKASWRGILSCLRAHILTEVYSKVICWLQFVHVCYINQINEQFHRECQKAYNSNHKLSCRNINKVTTCLVLDTVQGTPETHHHSWSCHCCPCWYHNLSVQIQCRRWPAIRQTKIWCPTLKVYIKVPQKK